MAKQTKITIETESLLILRGRSTNHAWCPTCATERDVIALEDIGVVSNLERSALEELLNSRILQQLKSTIVTDMIFLRSLIAQAQKRQKLPDHNILIPQTSHAVAKTKETI